MRFKSFARFFRSWWNSARNTAPRSKTSHKPRLRKRLDLETLEDRTTPSHPSIVASGVLPLDGTILTTGRPNIQVQFSEAMKGANGAGTANGTGAADLHNYLLVDPQGLPVTIDQATLDSTKTIVTLSYNGGQPLVVNNYTLYAFGDKLIGAPDNQPLSGPGQLVVANSGTSDLNVTSFTGNGTLGAVGQYPLPPGPAPIGTPAIQPAPNAVAVADFNGDGRPDLAIVDPATEQLDIYLGRDRANGYGFSLTADLVVGLPFTAAGKFMSIAVADFNNDGQPDIAIASSADGQIAVFIHSPTGLAFTLDKSSPPNTPYTVGTTPLGLVAADFDQDGNIDLATVDKANNKLDILRNNGDGTFPATLPAATTFALGALTSPDTLVAGPLNSDKYPDLVIGGSNGLVTMINTTSKIGKITFGVPTMYAGAAAASVAAAPLAEGINTIPFIGELTTAGNVWFYQNDGKGTLTGTQEFSANAGGGQLVLANLGGANGPAALVTNNANPGQLLVLHKAPVGGESGPITRAQFPNNQPYQITSHSHGLVSGMQITISGNSGIAAGVYTITVLDQDNFTLNGTTGTGQADISNQGTWTTIDPYVPAGGPYQVGDFPTALAVADTNGDDRQDVITVNAGFQDANFPIPGDFSLLLGQGQDLLQTPTSMALNFPITRAVATGDLNGDGIPDLVVVNKSNTNAFTKIGVLLGLPGGGYAPEVDFAAPAGIRNIVSVAIADVNGDGKPDIVFADQADNTVGFLKNNITGNGALINVGKTASFLPMTSVAVGAFPTQVLAADLNKDGHIDLLVSHDKPNSGASNRGVTVLMGNGDFTFGAPTEYARNTAADAIAVADFSHSGALDFMVVNDQAPGQLLWFRNDGTGNFTLANTYALPVNYPNSLAVGDLNLDGYPDIVVASLNTIPDPLTGAVDTNPGTGGVAVLLNEFGTAFATPLQFDVFPSTPTQTGVGLTSVSVTDLNGDGLPDVVVTTTKPVLPNTPPTFPPALPYSSADNVFVLYGQGDGTFANLTPYQTGQPYDTATNTPSYALVVNNPEVRVTTFRSGGTLVKPNLILNGNFAVPDLNNEQSNILGWNTFDLAATTGGSHGRWAVQKGNNSPLSSTAVPPPPSGKTQIMLDQPYLIPDMTAIGGLPDAYVNDKSTYSGTHALYQTVTIPSNATQVTLSLLLYLDSIEYTSAQFPPIGSGLSGSAIGDWSDTVTNPQLDYNTPAPNQQVRIDIMDPTNPNFQIQGVDAAHGVLQNIFITSPGEPLVQPSQLITADLAKYAGKTILVRIAETNNQGQLLVGVDKVQVKTLFSDTFTTNPTNPTLTNLQLHNPGVLINNVPHTTDATIVGQVNDVGSPRGIYFVEFSTDDSTFQGKNVIKIPANTFDATGNFTFTPTNLAPGLHTIYVRAVDLAGNTADGSIPVYLQDLSPLVWQAYGPNTNGVINQPLFVGPDAKDQFNVNPLAINFQTVSGPITSIVVSPADPTGNTYLVGSSNGGIWETFDGGKDWTPRTDFILDGSGNPISAPIGALAIAKSNPSILYAGLGVSDNRRDSRSGSGILKSTDGGVTWNLVGNSQTVFQNARISGMVVDPNPQNVGIVYAAVASGGQFGPGVYRSADAGLTWTNVLVPATMTLAGGAAVKGGTLMPSVTSLVLDPFNSNRILVGLGDVGLDSKADYTIAGVYLSINQGASWIQQLGGAQIGAVGQLPTGATTKLGRITIAMGYGRVGDESTTYYLIGTPPPAAPAAPALSNGGFLGLWKSDDNLLNFTKVMLKQIVTTIPVPTFYFNTPNVDKYNSNITLGGLDNADAGALAVDPSNVNVVFVGGTRQYNPSNSFDKSLIRVDTGDMLTAVQAAKLGFPLYAGDDNQKFLLAASQNFKYGGGGGKPDYFGEGPAWYDVEQDIQSDTSNEFGNGTSRIYPQVNALTIDTQGRLLIGTAGGLWRGTGLGFSYDFTSGGWGIFNWDFGLLPPTIQGMTLTDLNNNLQTLDLTSVAIDPTTPSNLYTSQVGLGSSASTGLLNWTSQGLIGPTVFYQPFNTNVNLGISTAVKVLAAPRLPGQAPDAPTTLYRLWQYANTESLIPEVSSDGGAHWIPLYSSGIDPTNKADAFPALAINSNPIFLNSLGEYELIFGTDRVYVTHTSTNAWDPLTGKALSTKGGLVTAVAGGPSNPPLTPNKDAYYAGTNLGEVFVTQNKGQDGMPELDAQLPKGHPVNGITVDPTDNRIAYVMFGGTGSFGHVWKTTDGGVNWKDISTNLPQVPAYDMVVDKKSTATAPLGKLFVATDVGVYISQDQAATWQKYGTGLPNVPTVQLNFNPTTGLLGVATQGRSVYTIQVDDIGPRITSISSSLTQSSFVVTFSKTIDPASFTNTQVTLTGPATPTGPGKVIPLTGIKDLDPGKDDRFQLTFDSSSLPGLYTANIGPNITDLVGNTMDQNQNMIQGEIPADVYVGQFMYQSQGNSAPVLGNTTPTVPSVLEETPTANNLGVDLKTFISTLQITDSDVNQQPSLGVPQGIAITSVDNTNGIWQYSLDSGTTWTSFTQLGPNQTDTVSPTEAVLLEAKSTDRIRFLPNVNYFSFVPGNSTFNNATTQPSFAFRAWDLTTGLSSYNGSDGGTADTTTNGLISAFSSGAGKASINVVLVNDAPSFDGGADQSTNENAGLQTVPKWAINITAGPGEDTIQKVHFVMTSNSNPNLFTVAPSIDATGTLTYQAAKDMIGTATLTVTLVDDGGTLNNGADTSFPATFKINILQVNGPPSFTGGPNIVVKPNAGTQSFPNWATNIVPGPANEPGLKVMFLTTGNTNVGLFIGQPVVTPSGTLNFTAAPNAHGIASITIKAKNDGGTANGGSDTSGPYTFTIAVDNAPVFTSQVGNMKVPHNSPPFTVSIPATDADNDPLKYWGAITGLQQFYAFHQDPQGYLQGSYGSDAKWIRATNDNNAWYFIKDNGDLGKWDGSGAVSGNIIGNVGTADYKDPTLLFNSTAPTNIGVTPVAPGSSNFTLTISPPASGFGGTFVVIATVSDGYVTVSQNFTVTATNSAPVFNSNFQNLNTLTISHTQLPYPTPPAALDITAVDPENDPITYTAAAMGLEQFYAFYKAPGGYAQGSYGSDAKWIRATNDNNAWYFIKDNGDLGKWDNSAAVSGTIIANVGVADYNDPTLLFNSAAPPVQATLTNNTQLNISYVAPATFYKGTFVLTATATDSFGAGTTHNVLVTLTNVAPTLDPVPDQVLTHTQTQVIVLLNQNRANPNVDSEGDAVTYTATVSGYNPLYDLQVKYGFYKDAAGYEQGFYGSDARWLRAQNDGNNWYVIKDNGDLLKWDGTRAVSGTFVTNVGVAAFNDPTLLTAAQAPADPQDSNGNKVTVSVTGNQVTLNVPSNYVGTFRVTAAVSDGMDSTTGTFLVTRPDTSPAIAEIAINHNDPNPVVTLPTTGANAGYTFSNSPAPTVKAYTRLFDLNTSYNLKGKSANYSQNYGGTNEKWVQAANGTWFFIRPDGDLFVWDNQASLATGTYVETLPTSVYADPTLLTNARTPVDPPPVTLSVNGNQLTISPPNTYAGEFRVNATITDGTVTTTKTFLVTVNNHPPVMQPVANQSMSAATGSLQVQLDVKDPDKDPLTFQVAIAGYSQEYNLKTSLGLFFTGNYFQNFYGFNEKWIRGNGGIWYAIKPSGEFDRLAANGSLQFVASLPQADYTDPSRLWNAQPPAAPTGVSGSVNTTTNVLTLTSNNGFVGTFQVTVTASDGIDSTSQVFLVTAS